MNNGKKVATFRDRITELVETSSKSQTDIAADIGISKQTISAWITGQNSPRKPTVAALANYFGVTIPWLWGFDVSKYDDSLPIMKESTPSFSALTEEEELLVLAWRKADDGIKTAIRKLLDIPDESKSI